MISKHTREFTIKEKTEDYKSFLVLRSNCPNGEELTSEEYVVLIENSTNLEYKLRFTFDLCYCCDSKLREFDSSTHYTYFIFEPKINSQMRDKIIDFIKDNYFDSDYFYFLSVQYFYEQCVPSIQSE